MFFLTSFGWLVECCQGSSIIILIRYVIFGTRDIYVICFFLRRLRWLLFLKCSWCIIVYKSSIHTRYLLAGVIDSILDSVKQTSVLIIRGLLHPLGPRIIIFCLLLLLFPSIGVLEAQRVAPDYMRLNCVRLNYITNKGIILPIAGNHLVHSF